MVRSVTALSILLASLGGCQSEGVLLTVELRTDLIAGEEFVSVETTVDGAGRQAAPATRRDDFIEGVQVATYDEVVRGSRLVEVTLRDADGTLVWTDITRVSLREDFGLRVVVARDCLAVGECPDEQKCVGGRCVPLECSLDADECGPPVCEAPSDCVAPVPACVVPVCTGVACLWSLDDDSCGAGERCDLTRGCVGDAPTDAGPDAPALPDGSADAAVDGGDECLVDGDCPADVFGAWGDCTPDPADVCSGVGDETRMVTRIQCVSRRCVTMMDVETQGCSFSTGGVRCGGRQCNVCSGGACVPAVSGESCSGGTATGGCREGRCCFGCWSGTACETGDIDSQCGGAGQPCAACPMGQYCQPMPFAGGGACTPI